MLKFLIQYCNSDSIVEHLSLHVQRTYHVFKVVAKARRRSTRYRAFSLSNICNCLIQKVGRHPGVLVHTDQLQIETNRVQLANFILVLQKHWKFDLVAR